MTTEEQMPPEEEHYCPYYEEENPFGEYSEQGTNAHVEEKNGESEEFPPMSEPEREKAVLSHLVKNGIHPDKHRLTRMCFRDELCEKVFYAYQLRMGTGRAHDHIGILDELDQRKQLDDDCKPFVGMLTRGIFIPENFDFSAHCRDMVNDNMKRKAVREMTSVSESSTFERVKDAIESSRQRMRSMDASDVAVINAVDVAKKAIEEDENPDSKKVVMTGYSRLDALTGGLGAGEYIVLGANTSVGKSALAVNIADNIIPSKRVLYITLEMSPGLLMQRIYGRDVNKLKSMMGEWKNLDFIDKGRTMDQLCANVERATEEKKYDAIMLDHFHLTKGVGGSLYEQRSMASNTVQELARETGLPWLVLCQLSRSNRHADRAPKLHDLRDAGTIEEDADKVLLLHRNGETAQLEVAKNRNGTTGLVDMHWDEKNIRFSEIHPAEREARE